MRLFEHPLYRASLERVLDDVNLDFLKGASVLVTGATGMVGSCLIDVLALWNATHDHSCRLIALSRGEDTAKERFSHLWTESTFSFIPQDVSLPIKEMGEVTYILHGASNADPVQLALHPANTLFSNIFGTKNLLDYGLLHGMKRFLLVSSGEVYGHPFSLESGFPEDYCGPLDLGSPRTCYPEGKRAAEVLCQSYRQEYDADIVIARPCHLFGPTMTNRDSRAVSEFLRDAAAGRPITIKSTGQLERSHCYIVDAIQALLMILQLGESGHAYNIAVPECQATILHFAETAAEIAGSSVIMTAPTPIETRGYSSVRRMVLDCRKLENLGWKSHYALKDGVQETIQILSELR